MATSELTLVVFNYKKESLSDCAKVIENTNLSIHDFKVNVEEYDRNDFGVSLYHTRNFNFEDLGMTSSEIVYQLEHKCEIISDIPYYDNDYRNYINTIFCSDDNSRITALVTCRKTKNNVLIRIFYV